MVAAGMQAGTPTDDLRENLHDEEELHWVVRPDGRARFTLALGSGLISAVVVGVLAGGIAFWFRGVAWGVLAFAGVLILHVGSSALGVYLKNAEYVATDQRLINYSGRFGRSLKSIPFEGIQDAEYDVSTVENLLGVGTVTIDTDHGYETMSFELVPDPAEFTRETVNIARQRGG